MTNLRLQAINDINTGEKDIRGYESTKVTEFF
jgi:hypothetical protein